MRQTTMVLLVAVALAFVAVPSVEAGPTDDPVAYAKDAADFFGSPEPGECVDMPTPQGHELCWR